MDWQAGTITRKRSKWADHPDAATITFKLWPETLSLLKRFRQKGENVLLNEKGKPLVSLTVDGGRWDSIRESWKTLTEQVPTTLPMKAFRKTSATLLEKHPVYRGYIQRFLAHTAKTVADRHYVRPDNVQFFAALDWLRKQYLG